MGQLTKAPILHLTEAPILHLTEAPILPLYHCWLFCLAPVSGIGAQDTLHTIMHLAEPPPV